MVKCQGEMWGRKWAVKGLGLAGELEGSRVVNRESVTNRATLQ